MQYPDYHTHTRLSPDSSAPLADMAAAAAAAGLCELCVTDHCDLLDESGGSFSGWDWAPALDQFQAVLPRLEGELRLRLGLELGVPHVNPAAAAAICACPSLDFVIGSIHNRSPEQGGVDFYFGEYGRTEACYAALDDYFTSMEALVQTSFYDVLGHIIYPLRYMSAPVTLERYWDRIRAILEIAAARGKGIELNTYRGRTVEDWRPLLALYRDCGGELVTLGSDAHTPDGVGKGVREGAELLRACGFRYVTIYERRVPAMLPLG